MLLEGMRERYFSFGGKSRMSLRFFNWHPAAEYKRLASFLAAICKFLTQMYNEKYIPKEEPMEKSAVDAYLLQLDIKSKV
jgi:hypothetical protein